ncbi:MAG: hypothetical protein EBR86_17085 [Planctomycetia bacterium]|nr:hypothetical protein [Planctomycetia bacterium]
MAEPVMPAAMISWMNARNWGWHHLEWHTVRQWDRLSPSDQRWATSQGWKRAARQEGEPGNGLEFLVMHRAMLELVRERFPTASALLAGWGQVPLDPDDAQDPVPPGNPRPFSPTMKRDVDRVHDDAFLRTLADDDAFGRLVQSGVHNYLHNRFSVAGDPYDLGDPQVNLGNQRFWRLHGWLDGRWSAYRAAQGLPAEDATLRAAIDAEKAHLGMHHMHGMVAAGGRAARAAGGEAAAMRRVAVPFSIGHPFADTVQRRFMAATAAGKSPGSVAELQEWLQIAAELEWFTLPPYLNAMWSIRDEHAHQKIHDIIFDIAIQEMLHLAIVCNLLVAIGGRPRLAEQDRFPKYPEFPPGIDLDRKVTLQPLSMEAIRLFMKIEHPSHTPIVIAERSAVPRAATIGEFYARLIEGFRTVKPAMSTTGQVTTGWFPQLEVFADVDAAVKALELVVEQGEGSTASAASAPGSGELAHYYRFQQIVDGMEFTQQPDGTFKKDPSKPLPFPPAADLFDTRVAPDPDLEPRYPGSDKVRAFDVLYTHMIADLERVWAAGTTDPDAELDRAIRRMKALSRAAAAVMALPAPDGQGVLGPRFAFARENAAPGGAVAPAALARLSRASDWRAIDSGAAPAGWHAWADRRPPGKARLVVAGEVTVANPGVIAFLHERVPQGFNARILQLELSFWQRPGVWTQAVTTRSVALVTSGTDYDGVEIHSGSAVVATMPVEPLV